MMRFSFCMASVSSSTVAKEDRVTMDPPPVISAMRCARICAAQEEAKHNGLGYGIQHLPTNNVFVSAMRCAAEEEANHDALDPEIQHLPTIEAFSSQTCVGCGPVLHRKKQDTIESGSGIQHLLAN